MNNWAKSTFCASSACIEVSLDPEFDQVLIRNSTNPNVFMAFSFSDWQAFIAGVKQGEFDGGHQ